LLHGTEARQADAAIQVLHSRLRRSPVIQDDFCCAANFARRGFLSAAGRHEKGFVKMQLKIVLSRRFPLDSWANKW
jgi:hypothetical protein